MAQKDQVRRFLVLSAALLIAGCAAPAPKTPQKVTPMVGEGSILHAWTEIVGGKPVARVLVEGPCPEILLDDRPPVQMEKATVCEHPLTGATRAQVADRLLPLPGTGPARIAVIGKIDAATAKTLARRQMPTLVVYAGEWSRDLLEPAAELLLVAPWQFSPEEGLPAYALRLFQEMNEPGYLLLVSKGGEDWDAILSTSQGDETRACRLGEDGFDCD